MPTLQRMPKHPNNNKYHAWAQCLQTSNASLVLHSTGRRARRTLAAKRKMKTNQNLHPSYASNVNHVNQQPNRQEIKISPPPSFFYGHIKQNETRSMSWLRQPDKSNNTIIYQWFIASKSQGYRRARCRRLHFNNFIFALSCRCEFIFWKKRKIQNTRNTPVNNKIIHT